MDTLRGTISDAVNNLNKLLLQTLDDSQEKSIRSLRDIYFQLWQEVILQELDNSTQEFRSAIEALKAAMQISADAQKDLKKITKVIELANSAAKAVDKIVKIGIKYV